MIRKFLTYNPIKVLVCMVLFSLGATTAQAQKFAYVDTEYILAQLPDYKSAQKQLDQLSEKWQKEVDAKYQEIDKLYKNYQAEEVLLNNEQKKQRQEEIITKEKEAKKLQQTKFGYEGELFRKREQLIKPIQDRVFDAIQTIAKREDLDFIFDKSGDMVMLFSNARFDKSGEVLEELGITPLDEKEVKDDGNPPDQNLPPED
ncbi:MAG: OmpH family outer membrane protein [Bacteroidia bacterium]|nr:OmpH family outer membrane protein [Bacteroidia bacterium]